MSSIFQTRHGEDAYPIGRFILDRAKALGFSRTDLVRRLGYRELNSGHRALTELMLTGMLPRFIHKKLAAAVEVEPDLLDAVLVATAQKLRDEAGTRMVANEQAYRVAFRPHLQVATARRVPSPIFIAAMLTWAATFSEIFLNAAACRLSGAPTTIGIPASPDSLTLIDSGIWPRSVELNRFARTWPPPAPKISCLSEQLGQTK